MKYILIFLMMIPSAFAYKIGGLKQRVILRHMGYTHAPKTRDKFNSFGSYFKYKEKQKEKIRRRLSNKLPALRSELSQFKEGHSELMGEYDPSLKFQFFTLGQEQNFESLKFPLNFSFRLAEYEQFPDVETVSITLKQKPSLEFLTSLGQMVQEIFNTTYPDLRKKKRFRNKKEKELYEPLKFKSYRYYQYEPYFAIYLGADYLVDSEYLRDLSGVLNSRYIKVFRAFKTRYFSSSSDIRNLVNNKVILDVQTVIENNKYKTLEEPFLIEKSKIPSGVLRLEDKINDIEIALLIAVNKESMNPKNERLISNFLNKSLE